MEGSFYKRCILTEVYADWGDPGLIGKIYCKYFRPSSNAVYLIRKQQFLGQQNNKLSKLRSKLISVKLARRYGVYVATDAQIGLGFKINHPIGICITNCKIGENFLIYQDCTIGVKSWAQYSPEYCPVIGDNCTMYTGSIVVGGINLCDRTEIAANACLVKSTTEPGVYAGTPAKLLKRFENGYFHPHSL